MKTIKKNGYMIVALGFFVISLAILVLFLTLFNQSTAVDGTTVGSVYIGDTEDEVKRRQRLTEDINAWKKSAMYSIDLQGIGFTIGHEPVMDSNGNYVLDATTGEMVYQYKGLEFLTFDYATTAQKLSADKANLAYYTVSDEGVDKLYATLVDYYGSTLCEDLNFADLIRDIEVSARKMDSIVDFDLYDYFNTFQNDQVSSVELENISEEKIEQLVDLFKDEKIEILPIEKTKNKLGFSAVEYFSNPKFADLSSADMSIIATGIAAVVQETSFTVTVKNQGYVSDRYYSYRGMTARVNVKDGTDLRVINPENNSYFIEITERLGELVFSLSGCRFVANYTIDVIKTPTMVDEDGNPTYIVEYSPEQSKLLGVPSDGIDTEKGCYYWIVTKGQPTYLYRYQKTTTYGEDTRFRDVVIVEDVYLKQEYYEGVTEYRLWTRDGYVPQQ